MKSTVEVVGEYLRQITFSDGYASSFGLPCFERLPVAVDSLVNGAVADLPDVGEVGVAVFTDRRHHYAATVRVAGDLVVAALTRTIDDLQVAEEVELLRSDRYRFTIDATEDHYAFAVQPIDGAPVALGSGRARLLSAEAVEWFVGVQFAVTASASASGVARFRDVNRIDVAAVERPRDVAASAAAPG